MSLWQKLTGWLRAEPSSAKRCGECFYWDYEAGQNAMAQHPVLRLIRATMTPDQFAAVSAGVSVDGRPPNEPSEQTRTKLEGRAHVWEQYGLCTYWGEGRNRFDSCEHWKTVKLRGKA
ncbi:MAG: hypothetical protein NZ898_17515 [Myxococcota bacterium]|nr:hypothetical protein [Myxococcota bacterium]MDW8364186.1 hypothetical protein [Myxococcales bacterium]